MSIFQGTPETLCNLVADGMQVRLKAALVEKLKASLMPLVESTADDVAKALVSKVQAVQNYQDNRLEVLVHFSARAREAVSEVARGL